MKRKALLQFFAGLILCGLAYFLGHREPYEVHTVLATAGGCRMATDFYEPRSGSPLGYAVIFHGLAANKKVMAFNAQEFANMDLRVFVPDLPGHGRTPGPYSPERDEECTLAFLRDLVARKAILPQRTILAGHSLGGAIAIRVAAKFPTAGVIALSPAPMQTAPGFSPEMVPFHDTPPLPRHSLVLSGQWEPGPIKNLSRQLVASSGDSSSRYEMIAGTTHVSILFSPKTFAETRTWTSQLLGTSIDAPFPKNMPALACFLGLLGLSILIPPFLHEMTPATEAERAPRAPSLRAWIGLAFIAVFLARLATPFRFLHLFQGDYLASFLFLCGVLVLLPLGKRIPDVRTFFSTLSLSAAAAGLLVSILFATWFELTFYEAWPTAARWVRLPLLFLCLLPWHLAEEIFLGEPASSLSFVRLGKAFALRAILWGAILIGVLYMHTGEVLFFLLAVYFILFSLAQRLACDLVRFRTRSPAEAAIFGAILLAAFALAIFPVA